MQAVKLAAATDAAATKCVQCVATTKTKAVCVEEAKAAFEAKIGRTVSTYHLLQVINGAAQKDYADKRKQCMHIKIGSTPCLDQARKSYMGKRCDKALVTDTFKPQDEVEKEAKKEEIQEKADIAGAANAALKDLPKCTKSVTECLAIAKNVSEAITGETGSSDAKIQEQVQAAAKDIISDNFRICISEAARTAGTATAPVSAITECTKKAALEYQSSIRTTSTVSTYQVSRMIREQAEIKGAEVVLLCNEDYNACIQAAKFEMEDMTGERFQTDMVKSIVKSRGGSLVAKKFRDCKAALLGDCSATAKADAAKLNGQTSSQSTISDYALAEEEARLKEQEWRERKKALQTLSDATAAKSNTNSNSKSKEEIAAAERI
jgi:hypothetical protein